MTDDRGRAADSRPLYVHVRDVCVAVEGLPPDLEARLRDLLTPFLTRSLAPTAAVRVRQSGRETTSATTWEVDYQGQPLRAFQTPDSLLQFVEWLVLSEVVAALDSCAALHSAALARGDATVVLLGDSGTGKTTLTLGLAQRGWEPLTDDILLLDRHTLLATAFPRCFHVEAPTQQLLCAVGGGAESPTGGWLVEPVGRLPGYARPGAWAEGERRVTCIVSVTRAPGRSSSCAPLTQAEAAGILHSAAVPTRLSRAERVRVAVGVAAGARRCMRLENGDFDRALDEIERAAES